MLSIVGLQGPDWVLIAADSSVSSSIICMSENYDRIAQLDDRHALAMSGETGDCLQLSEYLQGNVALYKFRNGVELSSDALAHFIRHTMAKAVRKSPYEVNMLLSGYDGKPHLYFMDYLGTLQSIPYGAQGYCQYFVMSVFDKHYKEGLTLEDGKELMKLALNQIKQRFTVAPHGFIVKLVDKNGITKIDLE
ncbi:Family T1, proteasome beta subunit, threonine peptidase [Trichomonas vaginalis G3]|uniref:Proteasome subunit beta n=1 Tax=Trichomonas vaginalis (strain ATCC PRA-98 / G3) TaxID=412133 RepID=A2F8W4_TRIV3|nr:threonine-type endopeptidase protein [Trichomonas vaginalis G3]EAX98646.1 Family T1, proteasome beta subunit, threonine peptidase [Trichomonas vaginalis G3]KAI5508440.1 threonine-type endopeptidase protein [Trichomonas vaginalis G3]|eukprot:XP_001311576.1 Family T1, proteasome beta subunit, threonine peptidase [Trichomonas vaginalis G3]